MSSSTLTLASTIDHTEAEGPGLRFAIWTQGCSLACPGCCNPHLWGAKGGQTWEVSELLERILAAKVKRPLLEGVSLIGGEPFQQDAALAELARGCHEAGLTVMAYSGYTLEEIRARGSLLLTHVDVLVDGLYVEALRTTTRRFIGSTNQRLHFLSDAYRADDSRFAEPNSAEIHLNDRGEIQVVGFPFDSVQAAFGPKRGRSSP